MHKLHATFLNSHTGCGVGFTLLPFLFLEGDELGLLLIVIWIVEYEV